MNIYSHEPIADTVNNLIESKGITDSRITDWMMKAEKRFFDEQTNDRPCTFVRHHMFREGEEEWMENCFEIVYDNDRMQFLSHVLDFFNTKDERYISKLYKKTWQDIYEREVPTWDEELYRSDSTIDKNDLVLDEDYTIIHTFDDGYKIIMALSERTCQYEGESMGHCAKNEHYKCKPKSIMSLWDRGNNPHTTMELNPPGSNQISQVKGKQNARPIEKYRQYIIKFISEKNYEITRDGENLGMMSYDSKYYFPDTPQWEEVYQTKIIPMQQAKIKEIMAMIQNA
jgi:hypothetical protein